MLTSVVRSSAARFVPWFGQTVLEDAELKKTEIDEIVLVGGSTRIPKVYLATDH